MRAEFHHADRRGLSTMEVLISVSVLSIVLLLAMVACVGLKRSFAATDDYFRSQGDQTRVLDYLATDMRRSLAAASGTNSVIFDGVTYTNTVPAGSLPVLTAILPNYWNETATPPAPRAPKVKKGKVNYGSAPVRVTYFSTGTELFRMELDPDLPAGDPRNLPRAIARDVGDFGGGLLLPAGTATIATARVTFAPKFSASGWNASLNPSSNTASRQGTTVATTVQLRNRLLSMGAGVP